MMARLDKICALNMGQSPDSSSYNESGNGIPFFQGNADFGELHPKVRIWCDNPTRIANIGDILISIRAPIGALNIANQKCCIGRGLAALAANEKRCKTKYLWYAVSSRIDELNSKGTGSTFKAISKKVLAETQIPLPPLDEQNHIAVVLDKVTDLIAKSKRQLEMLDELVKARFVEMFGKVNHNRWKTVSLGEICDVRDGTHDSPEYHTEGYPLITSKNVTSGEINFNDVNYISLADFEAINKRSKVDLGDIIMPMIGTIGKPVIVNTSRQFAIKNVALIKFNHNNPITNIFVKFLLQSDAFTDVVNGIKRGGTQKFIALGDIRSFSFYLPPLKLQKQFADFVKQTDKTKAQMQKSLEQLETLKKALMQKYFG